MTIQMLILLVGTVAIALAIWLEYALKRGKHRSLASRFARSRKATPLGMEATDIAKAQAILAKNSALAMKTGHARRQTTLIEVAAIPPAPYPEEETYAARYRGTHDERNDP